MISTDRSDRSRQNVRAVAPQRRWRKRVMRWSAVACGLYGGLCGLTMLFETSLVFRPPSARGSVQGKLFDLGFEEVRVPVDGATLVGYRTPAGPDLRPAVLAFSGKGVTCWKMSDLARRYAQEGWHFVAVDHRGFGHSTGSPSAAAFVADALRTFDHVVTLPGIDRRRVVVRGRSLGTAAAAHVGRWRAVAGVILVSPFDRLSSVGAERFPFLPVRWLLRNEMTPAEDAGGAAAPLLALHGDQDDIIRIERGRALRDAWKGPVTWLELPGRGHLDMDEQTRWDDVRTLLRAVGSETQPAPR